MHHVQTTALAELIDQHDKLRLIMDHCEELADALDDLPGTDPEPLLREIAKLRIAFDTHNKFEERLLRPVLLAHDSHGSVRVERMVEDHINEHRTVTARLSSPTTAGLRDVLETLRAHLDAEERYLLTSKVLRTQQLHGPQG
ncbi:MAG: hemerythrin domain-containing protein [Kofleriaceae bacterium]